MSRSNEALDVVAGELGFDREELKPTDRLDSFNIDSLDGMSILFGLEKKFNIELDRDALLECETVGDLLKKVEEAPVKEDADTYIRS